MIPGWGSIRSSTSRDPSPIWLARFLENHDEPRAAATFTHDTHEAAAITFLFPGLRFFHQGQLEGRTLRISPHLCRAPAQPVDGRLAGFHKRLLAVLRHPAVRNGAWRLLECAPAWDGNGTWDNFLVFAWEGSDRDRLLVALNDGPVRSQCYVRLPFGDLGGTRWRLDDLPGGATCEREGDDLQARGLYLDEPAWSALAFSLTVAHQSFLALPRRSAPASYGFIRS